MKPQQAKTISSTRARHGGDPARLSDDDLRQGPGHIFLAHVRAAEGTGPS